MLRRSFIGAGIFIGAGFLAMGLAGPAAARDYPNRNVTMVVPFAPAGATDISARLIAPPMAAKLGQSVVVENVSGGGTLIGAGRVARAAPDGYTLLLHNIAISAIPSLYPKLQFDLQKDVTPIGLVNSNPLIIAGRKSLPAENLSELIAWMKKNRAKIAHVGAGTSGHLITVLFAQAIGVEVDHIPYRGAGPALQDLVAGHVDLFFTTPNVLVGPIGAGQLKGFGVSSKERVEQLPKVESLVDALGPKLDMRYWHILFAPAGTPAPVIEKLNGALGNALDDQKVVSTWAQTGISVYPPAERSPAAAEKFFRSEIARWGEVIRDNKIEPPQQ